MLKRIARPSVVAALGLIPLAVVAGRFFFGDGLGAEPVEVATHVTGEWALRLLLLTLAITPLRIAFGFRHLAPLRRTLGLLAFTYATLHMLTWLALDQTFDWAFIVEDVTERPFVMAGLASFLAMVPLAATSSRAAIRRLGRRWVRLHRLVYFAAIAAIAHYVWLVKADLLSPLVHGAILALLLGWRVLEARRRSQGAQAQG